MQVSRGEGFDNACWWWLRLDDSESRDDCVG